MVRLTQMKWNGTVSQSRNSSIPPRLTTEKRAHPTSSQWNRRTGHSHRSSHTDPVSLPADRLDDVRSELPAEPRHVHVDDVRAGVEVEAPRRREELLLRQGAAGASHQLAKDEELPLGERHRTGARVGLPLDQIQPNRSDPKVGGGELGGPAEPRPDPGQELVQGE